VRSKRVTSALCAAALAWTHPAAAQTLASARAFTLGLYAAYARGEADHLGKDAAKVFAPRLLALIRRQQRLDVLDFDPICGCQDAGGLRVEAVSVRGRGDGRARAEVGLGFGGDLRRQVSLDLVAAHGGWRVEDVHTREAPSLVRLLQDAKLGDTRP
jgi:hypothetical protein